jgi:hypothetical protein
MVHIEGEIVICRPVETVFDFVADPRNEPRYNPHALRSDKLSDGSVGLGARFRTEIFSMGRTTEWFIEITKFERPRQFASAIHSSAAEIQGNQTFDPVDGGTCMRWSWDLKPRGIFKLLAPLIGRMGQSQEERNWENLKRFLEAH